MRGLRAEGAFVEDVAEDAEGEDGYCKAVACVAGVSAGELGESFVVVFWGAGLEGLEGGGRMGGVPWRAAVLEGVRLIGLLVKRWEVRLRRTSRIWG